MALNDPQRGTPAPDDDEVVDLEPTGRYQPGTGASQDVEFSGVVPHDRSIHMNLIAGNEVSLNSETATLLRSRLLSATLFIALAYLALSVLTLINRDSAMGPALPSGILRLVLSAALAGLLASAIPLSYSTLRALEYFYFGTMVVIHMVTQYVVIQRLVLAGDMPRLIGFEKNGVLSIFVMMMIYGIFIPNRPATTAKVVLSMALGPILVLAAVAESRSMNLVALDHLTSSQAALNNIVFILIGASLAIYTAYVLNGLRTDLRSARKLGQYQLGEKLGEGGMGEVYLAEHQLLKRPCALKLIKSDINTNVLALARFEREVQSSAMLSHPNSISIYDYGHTPDGTFYYVMEHLPGMSVADLVKQFGPLPAGRTVYIIRQVCGALAEAHNLGLVHRDLKPANIFIAILGGKFDVAKVLDYGLVKLTNDKATQLTTDYTVSGTPLYMSPEQATATAVLDGRSDLYALGAILYYMLTGKPPFEGKTAMEVMISHARDDVTPPSEIKPGIPKDLEAVIMRCLAKVPEARYQDAKALSNALAACACSTEWDDAKAEAWWAEQAMARLSHEPGGAA